MGLLQSLIFHGKRQHNFELLMLGLQFSLSIWIALENWGTWSPIGNLLGAGFVVLTTVQWMSIAAVECAPSSTAARWARGLGARVVQGIEWAFY